MELANIINTLERITYSVIINNGIAIFGAMMNVEYVEDDEEFYYLYSGSKLMKLAKNVREIKLEEECMKTYILLYDGYEVSISILT